MYYFCMLLKGSDQCQIEIIKKHSNVRREDSTSGMIVSCVTVCGFLIPPQLRTCWPTIQFHVIISQLAFHIVGETM